MKLRKVKKHGFIVKKYDFFIEILLNTKRKCIIKIIPKKRPKNFRIDLFVKKCKKCNLTSRKHKQDKLLF